MAFLVSRDSGQMAELGFSPYAHVPFLLSRDMKYLDEFNRFLRERALGTWHPNNRNGTAFGRVRALGANSASAYADDLKNFASYLETKRLSWTTLTYQQLLDTYDVDQSTGKWRSRGKNPLAASTINRRMNTVVEFLLWASDRQIRGEFQIQRSALPQRRAARARSWSSDSPIDSRVGIHRANPKRLRLPTSEEIEIWLAEVRARHGRARYMAIKFILQTGCRLEETSLVRAAQVPDPQSIDLDMPARMDIEFGTKGKRNPFDPDLRGKPRTLRFSRSFLVELHNYKELAREKALKAFRARDEAAPLPLRLFLDEDTGRPLSTQAIYRAWKTAVNLPFPGWSPHLGRHAFACYQLLRLLTEEAALIQRTLSSVPRAQTLLQVENLISVFLSPVMGHVDEKTTETYLEWVADHLWVSEHRRAWTSYLEDGDE